MSTNTTSRAITWRPRYAWMPVSTRHMRNGTHMRARRSWATALFKHLGEGLHVEIDGLDERVRSLHGADGGGQDSRFGPGLLSDSLYELEVAPRLSDDRLHTVLLHEIDELDDVIRGRRNTGPFLDGADLDDAETREQVDPQRVVHDHRRALVGLEGLGPAAHRLVD